MSALSEAREARLMRRFEELTSSDAQLVAAQPDPAIAAALDSPDMGLVDVMGTVMTGYADRPALSERAIEFVGDAAGRTVAQLQPRFDTLTYRETWARVQALAHALAGDPVRPGDRVATLGFISADYAIVDMALSLTGAVAVPLQTSAPVQQLHPILVETEPVAMLSSVDHLPDAVEVAQGVDDLRRHIAVHRDQSRLTDDMAWVAAQDLLPRRALQRDRHTFWIRPADAADSADFPSRLFSRARSR